jgi:hypothetical protein
VGFEGGLFWGTGSLPSGVCVVDWRSVWFKFSYVGEGAAATAH